MDGRSVGSGTRRTRKALPDLLMGAWGQQSLGSGEPPERSSHPPLGTPGWGGLSYGPRELLRSSVREGGMRGLRLWRHVKVGSYATGDAVEMGHGEVVGEGPGG